MISVVIVFTQNSLEDLALKIALTLITFLVFTSNTFAKKVGWRESFGGNSSTIEFKQIASDVANVLIEKKYKNNFGLDVSSLPNIIAASLVECGSNLILDNEAKDAINYPNLSPQKIILDCKKWADNLSYAQKLNLVVHEYLPLAGIDDSSNEYSLKIVNFYKKVFKNTHDVDALILNSIRICDLSWFDELVGLGANVFSEDEYGSIKTLDTAIKYSCDGAIDALFKLGVEYTQNDNTPSYVHLIENAFYSYNTSEKERVIITMQKLINLWPELLNFTFTQSSYSALNSLSPQCYTGSSVLHVLATTRSIKKEDFDYSFFYSLAILGFSLEQNNVCGQTPAKLLEQTFTKPFFY